jgi:hypothetical protein
MGSVRIVGHPEVGAQSPPAPRGPLFVADSDGGAGLEVGRVVGTEVTCPDAVQLPTGSQSGRWR